MATTPLVKDLETLSVEVRVGGRPIASTYQILDIDVRREINRVPIAQVILVDGDLAAATFKGSEADDFTPGKPVELRAGYGTSNTPIFVGIIVSQGVRVRPDGTSMLVLTCKDRAAKLALTRTSAQYVNKTDSDIIKGLIASAGLTADVDATTVQHPQLIQQYSSAWDFIVGRADANGLFVVVEDGTVRVRAPTFAKPSLVVRYGESIGELEAQIDAGSQLPVITGRAWDPATQALVTASSSEPTVNEQGNISGQSLLDAFGLKACELQTFAAATPAALKAWANGRLLRSRLARIRGTVTCPGNATPKPGGTIELAGLGARFNGTAFLSSVEHHIEAGEWKTSVGFGLPPEPYSATTTAIESPGAAGLVPPARGLQIARVLQIHEDPDNQRRIKVLLPLVTGGAEGVWVRMLAPYATEQAGMYFMPEVNDEIVLGFLGDDPASAVMLGSLHSSKRAAPYTPDQPNTTKAIVSKSKLKVTFDDAKKIVTIETPGGHVITLSDDTKDITIVDSSKNEIAMSSAGIRLTSKSDIALSATGSVTIEGKTGVTITSPADVSASGLNVKIAAKVALSAQGQASAELSASGKATVRGALVMIN